jgi:hypothetical protein
VRVNVIAGVDRERSPGHVGHRHPRLHRLLDQPDLFSAVGQRRRRCTEVITSTRGAGAFGSEGIVVIIGVCLALSSYATCPVKTVPGKEAAVFGAIRELGRSSGQLKHLIFTHGHPDHIGSAAAIVRETGARTYMHPLDIAMAESGGPFRPMSPAPGLLGQVLCRLFFNPEQRLEPVAIDHPLTAGDTLEVEGFWEDRWSTLGVGDVCDVPSGLKHGWRNLSGASASMLVVVPMRLGRFFSDIARCAKRLATLRRRPSGWSAAPLFG